MDSVNNEYFIDLVQTKTKKHFIFYAGEIDPDYISQSNCKIIPFKDRKNSKIIKNLIIRNALEVVEDIFRFLEVEKLDYKYFEELKTVPIIDLNLKDYSCIFNLLGILQKFELAISNPFVLALLYINNCLITSYEDFIVFVPQKDLDEYLENLENYQLIF